MRDASILFAFSVATMFRASPFRPHWLVSHGILACMDVFGGVTLEDMERLGL